MEILIRKEPNGSIYLDKTNASYFDTLNMSAPPYNFTKIIIDDQYADCEPTDFNSDLTFSVEKYNERKQQFLKEKEILELKQKLIPIKEDVEQVELFGIVRDDYSEKKQQCADIINKIRFLMGKEPRETTK